MKQLDYAMRYLGTRNPRELISIRARRRLIRRTDAVITTPSKAVVYSNGVFTVAIVTARDAHVDPDRVYMGVSKKCDRDNTNMDIGIRIAVVRAVKAYLIGEKEHGTRPNKEGSHNLIDSLLENRAHHASKEPEYCGCGCDGNTTDEHHG